MFRETHLRTNRSLVTLVAAAFLTTQNIQAASNLPTGGNFVSGSGNISTSGNILTINQNSLKGIIDWNSFSIGHGATVNFKNGAGATLNRVTGAVPSTILGHLLATGNIYLINPEGILIGHGATIHTGGDFLATTLNLPNSFFLNNHFQFTGNSPATVVNLGDIASAGGSIYLIGRTVQNGGSISSANGTAGLAAGSQVLITDSLSNQKVAVEAPGGDVTNSGFIHAAQVELKSNGGNIYALAGNNGGLINATGTATQDGHVWMIATDGTTNVSGLISATNANGVGGAIETSGAHVNTNGAQITTGKGGKWLLDPDDLTIDSSLAGTIETSLNGGTNVTEQTGNGNTGNGDITVASNIAWTSGADLTLSAYRNIGVNNGVTISNTAAGNLTLRADNTSTGTGTVNFTGTGKVDFSASTGNVSILYNPSSYASPTNYSSNVLTNGSWTAPSDGSVTSQSTAYMLVNSAANLQNLDQNDAGTYALGKDIDLSAIANFVPLGGGDGFSGILDGMGHSISNLTVSGLTTNSGLFSTIANAGDVRNLSLINANVSVTNSYANAGTLAGFAYGTIANVSASGAVTIAQEEEGVGGLVGYLYGGTILNSHADVTVSAPQATYYVGGLVGYNYEGSITNSYATGSVSAEGAYVGGLVGEDEYATTTNSYATGAVSITDGSYAGGLIGYSESSTISGSHASGNVSSATSAETGGLVGETYYTPVTNSYATGSVSGVGDSVGGLIGEADGPVSNSFAVGNVAAGPSAYVGGLTGSSYDVVSTSYALGSVTGGAGAYLGGLVGWAGWNVTDTYARGALTATGAGAYIGGLVGWLAGVPVTRSYSSGLVTGPSAAAAGGLVGNNNSGVITSSYWDDIASGFLTIGVGSGDSTGVVGLTTTQLTTGAMPSGFNATNTVWTAPALVYPYFGWQGPLVHVAGSASNGPNLLNGAGVSVLWQGAVVGNTVTQSGGLYGLLIPQNMTTGGLLNFLTSGGTANSFSDGTSSVGFTGMNLANGAVFALDGSIATLSALNGAMSTALGGNSGSNFLFTVPNGHLNLNSGTNLELLTYPNFTVDQPLNVPGSLLFGTVGNLTIANENSITTGSGNTITIGVGVGGTGAFTNNAGGSALSVSGGGTWLVYSQNPANDTLDGLSPDFKQYNAELGATPSHSGNGMLYSLAPVITPSLIGSTSKTYDGTNTATLTSANFTSTGAVSGDTVTLTTPSTGTYSSPNVATEIAVSATGLAVASASSGGTPVYGYQVSETPATGNIGTISPAFLTYTANGASRTYGAANPTFSGTVTGFVNEQTLATATSGTAAFTSTADTLSNVGSYAINGSGLIANNGNYTFLQAESNPSALTISPAFLTYTANGASRTYGAANPTFSGTVTGFVNEQTLATATSGTAAFTSTADTLSNVGSYAINGSGLIANNGNYTFLQAESNPSALTISPAFLTYTANGASRTYGAANPTFSGTVTGFVNEQTLATATTGTAAFTSTADTLSNVGSYAINGSGLIANNGNYTFLQAESNPSALTISPAFLTYTANGASRTYGAANPTFSGTVTGFVNEQTLATATTGTAAFTSTADTLSNVGSYAINGSGLIANNGNYTFLQAESNPSALTISPAFLTYTANGASRTYGAANPTFSGTVTGFVNEQTLATATTGTAAFTSTADTLSNVGSYAINGSGLIANNGNYTFLQAESNPSALTISPAFLTYTANGASRTYGAANPTFSGTVTGFVNEQTLATATSGTAAFTSTADTLSNVGSYAINGSGLIANNGNYTFLQAESNPSALTISPAFLTYTANGASRTYGAANPTFSGTVTGFVNEQTLATATTGTAAFTSTADTLSNVGSYAINGSGLIANNGNYTFLQAESNPSALTISPAFLTYTANGASRTYGAANPTFSGTVTGFVNEQTLATATTGTAAFTSTADTLSNVGSYAINGSGLIANNGNYTFLQAESNPSALTISPAFLTYTANGASRTYGAANPTFSGTVTGFVNEQTLATATTGTAAFTSTADTLSNVGSYAINGSGLIANNGNYTFLQAESNPSALTISPAFLTYTANGASRTYGAANPTFSGTVTGFVNEQTLATATTGTAAFTSTADTLSNVGSYAINGSGLTVNSGNYVFTQAEGNASALTINPATLTYTANAGSRTYGAANPSFTGSVTGFVGDQTLVSATSGSATFTSSATAASNVGAYAINGSGLTANNGNYVFTQADGNASALTINPATLTYSANPASQTYGSSNNSFTGSVSGFVNGQTLASATTGSAAFTAATSASSPAGTYSIDGSGLTANHGNYIFTQAPSNATALTLTAASVPTPTSTAITIDVNNVTSLSGQTPTFTATYIGSPVDGLNITSALAGLVYQVTPAVNGPGTYTITATGTAPTGYSFNFVPGTYTVLDNSPVALPTQTRLFVPETPALFPVVVSGSESSILSPVNSLGLFQIITAPNAGGSNGPGVSFAGFDNQQTPLAQDTYFGPSNNKRNTFVAGAKP